ncbi:uncharacterized protein LOC110423492 [Herrania umbratica]|uniref:Uncharacterized protein LOC110423492 n=1 Tax=Herrania umbratica TaxID=108875 RepID=A0A6J1B2I3_9ROSI|nr:uncharacterized protein LOC110423492 [Herrania umbratica]
MLDNEEFEEERQFVEDFESDYDEIRLDVEDPYSLTKDDKERIRKPWRRTLMLWSLKGEFQAMDLDNGYYCFKYSNKSDYDYVLSEGTWIIVDHYLTIRRWIPGFRYDEAFIDSVAAWIRLLRLPLEFYDEDVLSRIANKLGRTLKVDRTTFYAIKGKFERLCVELDLTKPLVVKIYIKGHWQKIECEGL